jgi:hypothetical protein
MQPEIPEVLPYRSQRASTDSTVARRSFHFAVATTFLLCVILASGLVLADRVIASQSRDVLRLAFMLIAGGWGVVTVPFSIYGLSCAVAGWRDSRDRRSRNFWQAVVALTLHALLTLAGIAAILCAMALVARSSRAY